MPEPILTQSDFAAFHATLIGTQIASSLLAAELPSADARCYCVRSHQLPFQPGTVTNPSDTSRALVHGPTDNFDNHTIVVVIESVYV